MQIWTSDHQTSSISTFEYSTLLYYSAARLCCVFTGRCYGHALVLNVRRRRYDDQGYWSNGWLTVRSRLNLSLVMFCCCVAVPSWHKNTNTNTNNNNHYNYYYYHNCRIHYNRDLYHYWYIYIISIIRTNIRTRGNIAE